MTPEKLKTYNRGSEAWCRGVEEILTRLESESSPPGEVLGVPGAGTTPPDEGRQKEPYVITKAAEFRERRVDKIAQLEHAVSELEARLEEAGKREAEEWTLPDGFMNGVDNFLRMYDSPHKNEDWLDAVAKTLRGQRKRAVTLFLRLESERDTLRRERDAYKKAKEENDERLMSERDEARDEVDRQKHEREVSEGYRQHAESQLAEVTRRFEGMREALERSRPHVSTYGWAPGIISTDSQLRVIHERVFLDLKRDILARFPLPETSEATPSEPKEQE